MDSTELIYQENILDHYKSPRNFGKIENATVHHHEYNPLCGDEIDLFLVIDENKKVDEGLSSDMVSESRRASLACHSKPSIFGQAFCDSKKVVDVKFYGKGCAISQASASMLSEEIKGKSLEELKNFKKEDILEMLGIPISPVRLKCALLSLDTLKNSILIFERYIIK